MSSDYDCVWHSKDPVSVSWKKECRTSVPGGKGVWDTLYTQSPPTGRASPKGTSTLGTRIPSTTKLSFTTCTEEPRLLWSTSWTGSLRHVEPLASHEFWRSMSLLRHFTRSIPFVCSRTLNPSKSFCTSVRPPGTVWGRVEFHLLKTPLNKRRLDN